VDVTEIITGVNVALGLLPVTACSNFDANFDLQITVEEIILAVNAALNGCLPTPTPTTTPPCGDPNADPDANCRCRRGFHLENAFGLAAPEGFDDGDDSPGARPPSRADERLRCVPDVLCAPGGLDCGERGACVAAPGGTAGCDCQSKYGGPRCDLCLPPYQLTGEGDCELGDECRKERCSDRGRCVENPSTGEIGCACDDGTAGTSCAQVDFRLIKPVRSIEIDDTTELRAVFPGGPCGEVKWTIIQGGGSLSGSGNEVEYTAPASVTNLVDVIVIAAAPENCPELEKRISLHVVDDDASPIQGVAEPLLEPLDEAVLEYMMDHQMTGGAVTIAYRERILYDKGFGFARLQANPIIIEPMTAGHLMRLASVSKPITRAAIRKLQADGLLNGGANGLNDAVFPILQTEGGNLLNIDGANMPAAPLQAGEYQTGTPGLCDTANPPNCPPAPGPPLMCPVGTQGAGGGGLTCPLGTPAGSAPNFVLTANLWNLDGGNPRVGGTPQYNCPTDDNGQVDAALWNLITVGDLLWHRGGFYRGAGYVDTLNGNVNLTGDVTYMPAFISQRLPIAHTPPPTAQDIMRFAAGSCLYYQPVGCDDSCCNAGNVPQVVDPFGYCTELDGDTYSNLGYSLLGRVIEVRSGTAYTDYVEQNLFTPNGITSIIPGRTRPGDRDPREPDYFSRGQKMGADLFTADCSGNDEVACSDGTWQFPNQALVPDGGDFAMEYRDAQGGWVATSCAMVNFMNFYRIADGLARTLGSFPTGGEGGMFGAFEGTRAYVAQWGDPVTIVDTDNVPMNCTAWSCLNSMTTNLPLGAGFHIAAIFNKRDCTPTDCDVSGGYNFTKHSTGALPNHFAEALSKITSLPGKSAVCGCGNCVLDPGEQCDADQLGGESCQSLGFEGGMLQCTAKCTYDTEACLLCGNGVVDESEGEVCDGTDFDGSSCATFGFEMGDLACIGCLGIDTSGCSGGMSLSPPAGYAACGFEDEDCSAGSCVGAEGDCLGGPCKMTDPGDYGSALSDPFNTQGGEFHPDGNFRDGQNNLYFCRRDDNDTEMVCIDDDGWGVCKRCSPMDGELNTLLGCPCTSEEQCDSASEPGLGCFGEDFGGGTGFCWDSQDGPPSWQCREGICGMAPWYGDDTMYCEHYPEPPGPAHCEPWGECNAILARACAGQKRICKEEALGCTEEECCVEGCEEDSQCTEEFGWPQGYECADTGEGLQCVGP
jgi:CubicO group peptidase (beta-lactamase class C family)